MASTAMTSGQPEPAAIPGQCLCGAVRFQITPPTLWCAHCHCEYCRRAHGAPFVTWVGVPEPRFHLLAGEEVLRRYHSSAAATRSRCGACGSPLFFQGSRWPGEVHVAAAALCGPLDRAPAAHVYWDQRLPGLEFDDPLPRLGGETGTGPLDPDGGR